MTLQPVLSSTRIPGPRQGSLWRLTLACGHTVTRPRQRRWWWPVRAPKRVRCGECEAQQAVTPKPLEVLP
jgi:hypothetical protein